jgi:crossover junction endodeoxyribonuclease RuvC
MTYVADGTVHSDAKRPLAWRLRDLHDGLIEVMRQYDPDEAAVEEAFVNKNPTSTLKLGLARGVALLTPALVGLTVAEYSANRIKKAVVGVGHARKEQVQMMVGRLLPGCDFSSADSADALAVAICHAHFTGTDRRWASAVVEAVP